MNIAADPFSVATVALGLLLGLFVGAIVHSGTRMAIGRRADPLIGGSLMGVIAMALASGGPWWWAVTTVLVGHNLSIKFWSRNAPRAPPMP